MGFGQAMKAANMNFGTVDSPDFEACYLTLKSFKNNDGTFIIVGAQAGTYEFTHDDVKFVNVIASGGNWVKYYMKFNDGKIAVVTSTIPDSTNKSGASMAPFERFFGDLFFKNIPVKTCPKCGHEIDDSMLFCGECGEKLK